VEVRPPARTRTATSTRSRRSCPSRPTASWGPRVGGDGAVAANVV